MEWVCTDNGTDGHFEDRGFNNNNPAYGQAPIASTGAEMVAKPYDTCYNMAHKKRGMAIIFNQKFLNSEYERYGTDIDCAGLKEVLEDLDFKVFPFESKLQAEVKHILKEAAKVDHTDHDCICVCVMTHGGDGCLAAEDKTYPYKELWEDFTNEACPSLAGKPKIFFIQACRGSERDAGTSIQINAQDDGPAVQRHIKISPDFLIGFSTLPAYVSNRDKIKGSWFIQSLIENLGLYGKRLSILTILTFVSQRVAYDYIWENKDNETNIKQIPCITTTLTRKLIFGDKQLNKLQNI